MEQIKISLYKFVDYGFRHVFTYPHIANMQVMNADTQWLRYINMPRTMAEKLQVRDEAYVMWRNYLGTYFALVVPDNTRGSYQQITMFIDKNTFVDSSSIEESLHKLKEVLVDMNSKDPQLVKNVVSQILVIPDENPITETTISRQTAYCRYENSSELYTVLGHVSEDIVRQFNNVWIVKGIASAAPIAGLTSLDEILKYVPEPEPEPTPEPLPDSTPINTQPTAEVPTPSVPSSETIYEEAAPPVPPQPEPQYQNPPSTAAQDENTIIDQSLTGAGTSSVDNYAQQLNAGMQPPTPQPMMQEKGKGLLIFLLSMIVTLVILLAIIAAILFFNGKKNKTDANNDDVELSIDEAADSAAVDTAAVDIAVADTVAADVAAEIPAQTQVAVPVQRAPVPPQSTYTLGDSDSDW